MTDTTLIIPATEAVGESDQITADTPVLDTSPVIAPATPEFVATSPVTSTLAPETIVSPVDSTPIPITDGALIAPIVSPGVGVVEATTTSATTTPAISATTTDSTASTSTQFTIPTEATSTPVTATSTQATRNSRKKIV